MKKNILIFCGVLLIMSLTAFGFIKWNDSNSEPFETSLNENVVSNEQAMSKMDDRIFTDFIYDVGTRFSPIKKSELDKSRTIINFLDPLQVKKIVSYTSVSVIIIEGDLETDVRENGSSELLTAAQIKLLQSSNYSTNLKFRIEYQQKNTETGEIEESYSTPHLTIVPEKQAEYEGGKDALMTYFKESIKFYTTNIQADKLQPAKLYFTVTKNGTVEKINLDRSSNFPEIDKKMIELINNVPGKWKPAENSQGEIVDQELVISFGLMGC